MLTMYVSSMRVSELVRLKVRHLKFRTKKNDNHEIPKAKGGPRTFYLSPEVLRKLKAFTKSKSKDEYVF